MVNEKLVNSKLVQKSRPCQEDKNSYTRQNGDSTRP